MTIKMTCETYLDFPYSIDCCGDKTVQNYVNIIGEDNKCSVYTIDNNLEIVNCEGYISYYKDKEEKMFARRDDDMNLKMYCLFGQRWFTLNKTEVKELQKEFISQWKQVLKTELERIENLENQ